MTFSRTTGVPVHDYLVSVLRSDPDEIAESIPNDSRREPGRRERRPSRLRSGLNGIGATDALDVFAECNPDSVYFIRSARASAPPWRRRPVR